MKKREFIKYGGLLAGAAFTGSTLSFVNESMKNTNSVRRRKGSLKLRFVPYDIQLKHVFTIANNSRTSTPVVLTQIEYEGLKDSEKPLCRLISAKVMKLF